MKKCSIVFIGVLLVLPLTSLAVASTRDIPLPPPSDVSMILEESIWRRSSIRNFTNESITQQELSTILWAAYGLRGDGSRTIPAINGVYAVHLYVILEDAVYTYDPMNHSLVLYKEGDYRYIGQYAAPVLLGLTWDSSINSDVDLSSAEIGEIGQNIQLVTNALGLGSVINGDFPPTYTLARIGLPSNEIGKIIIPMGHLVFPYNFKYMPVWISLLPRIQKSSLSLTTTLKERNESTAWQGELSRQEQDQMLWSAYGYNLLVDKSDFEFVYHISRHRTVPSAHGYYPLQIYAVTKTGMYHYIPNIYDPLYGNLRLVYLLPKFAFPIVTYLQKITGGDFRSDTANATGDPSIASAPLITVIVLDLQRAKIGRDDFSGEIWWWLWYYEAGSAAQNMFLEATAWNLTSGLVLPSDVPALRTVLHLSEDYVPMIIIPVGQ